MLKIVGLLVKKIINDYCEGHNCDFTYEKIEDEEYVLMCEDIFHIDEYGKEYNKSSSFKIYYKSETGIVPLNVSYDQNEKANKIVASSPTYVATTDDELTGKTTVNSKDIDANSDYVKIPKGEILNYTTVIDGKDPPTPIVIPRTFSYITQFQINGDFIEYGVYNDILDVL